MFLNFLNLDFCDFTRMLLKIFSTLPKQHSRVNTAFFGNLAYSLHFNSFYSQHIFHLHYYTLFLLCKIFLENFKEKIQNAEAPLPLWSFFNLAFLIFALFFMELACMNQKVHKIKVLNQCASNYQGGTGNCDVIRTLAKLSGWVTSLAASFTSLLQGCYTAADSEMVVVMLESQNSKYIFKIWYFIMILPTARTALSAT